MTQNPFLNTLLGHPGKRPPVWLMRQAGRVLPHYRQLREQYSFEELMLKPELAASITMMPVEDLGVDAAILFSDILTIPVAMGMKIEWTERGPRFPHPLHLLKRPAERLNIDPERLGHVYRAIDSVVERSHVPLIGFCGAPLTTLCYMLQGISSKQTFPEAKKFFYENRLQTERLVDAVTECSIAYAVKQIEHGIDAFQLFESHAGLVSPDFYASLFLPAVCRIASAVRERGIPLIFFPKGLGCSLSLITPDVCDVVSIDWQTPLTDARLMVHPDVGLQGNLDPHLLFAPQEEIARTMEGYKPFFKAHPRWVVNLGHGILADTPLENVRYLVEWVKNTQW